VISYLRNLPPNRQILWSFVIWYAWFLLLYFDPNPGLWLTSTGVAVLVGFALMMSTGPVTQERFKTKFWECFRLFLCPLMVSSFSALVKGEGFIIVLSPLWWENLAGIALVGMFWAGTEAIKRRR
jgi:hypothetical protein